MSIPIENGEVRKLIYLLSITESLVLSRVHELVNLSSIRELDLNHPTLVLSVLVNEGDVVSESLVDGNDSTANRGVHIVGRLHRLDSSEGLALRDSGAL